MLTPTDIDFGTPASVTEEQVTLDIDGYPVRVPKGTSLLRAVFAAADAVDHLHPAGGPDPAGRALAAAFERAKVHRVARKLGHVSGVVMHHHTAMA